MSFDIYKSSDYKELIKNKLEESKRAGRPLTLKKIADLIPVQYTYLSKVMNHAEFHLNEDHLFTICQTLGFLPEESDYVLLLRSWATAQATERRKYLYNKLEQIRRSQKLNVEKRESDGLKLTGELNYLLNPLCIVVHVAMTNSILRKNPQALCSKLGISVKQLKEILKILAQNDLIDLSEDRLTVKAVKASHFHLGKDHPLMRVHQNLLKTSLINRMNQTEEEMKHSFMVTFTLDQEGFELIKFEFQGFLKKVEGIARRSQRPQDHQEVYNMNFDLLRWV